MPASARRLATGGCRRAGGLPRRSDRLRPANLLTGQLYVAVDVFPDVPPVAVDWSKRPVELPTAPAALEELQGTIAGLARKLGKLPLDTIAADAQRAPHVRRGGTH